LRWLCGGGDHYRAKPMKLLELTAIFDSLGRRVGSSEWLLLAESRRLQSPEGLESELTAAEMVIFQLLLNHPGQVISRRQIVEALGHSWVDYDLRRLDTGVSRLRRRWREKYEVELPLKTEHSDGYSVCEVLSEV
ncbi:response regulator transcription factor, partial [Plesiomonas shigelloides]